MTHDWILQSIEKRRLRDADRADCREREGQAGEVIEVGIVPVWSFVMESMQSAIEIANDALGEARLSFRLRPEGFSVDWPMNAGESVVGELEIEERKVSLIYLLDGERLELEYEVFVEGAMIRFRAPEGRVVSHEEMAREILERLINPEQ